MLGDTSARQVYFSKLAQPNESDHGEIKKVKNKINSLIQQELDLAGFKDKMSENDKMALETDTFNEVATNSNFYFSFD